MDAAEEERLEAALQVVQAIMQHEVSALLFNVPVDPVKLGIPDYFTVIKQPMVSCCACLGCSRAFASYRASRHGRQGGSG